MPSEETSRRWWPARVVLKRTGASLRFYICGFPGGRPGINTWAGCARLPPHAGGLLPPPRRADRPAGGDRRREPPASSAAMASADGRGSRGFDGGTGAMEPADVAAGFVGFGASRRWSGDAGIGGVSATGAPASRSAAPDRRAGGDCVGRGWRRAVQPAPPVAAPPPSRGPVVGGDDGDESGGVLVVPCLRRPVRQAG